MKKWLTDIICLYLILNFFYEGIYQLAFFQQYSFWINHAPVIKKSGSFLQYLIPTLLFYTSFCLIAQKYRSTGFVLVILAELVFTLWIIYVYKYTGYLFWPFNAFWNNPTWIEKMIYGLFMAWLAIAGAVLHQPSEAKKRKISAEYFKGKPKT